MAGAIAVIDRCERNAGDEEDPTEDIHPYLPKKKPKKLIYFQHILKTLLLKLINR